MNSNMHPDHARFSNNRFRLPPIPPARNDTAWKLSKFPFKHRLGQESHVLPPLFLSVTETSSSTPIHDRGGFIRRASGQDADQSDEEPREIFSLPKVHQHHTAGAGRSLEVPWMPRRLPFRSDTSQDLPFQRSNQIGKGPWNALLGVASAEMQAQPHDLPGTKTKKKAIVVEPRLQPPLPVLPPPSRLRLLHDCTSSPTSAYVASNSSRIDPTIAKASRARRLAARRNAAKLKRHREVIEERNSPPAAQRTSPVPAPAKSGKRNENNRRRLANRASVQKCRNKQKIRCRKLHAERDLLSEENKILKDLRDEINASGILKLKVAAAISAEGQEFLQNYGGLIAEPVRDGGDDSLRNTASGHSYYRSRNNGAIIRRFEPIHENTAAQEDDRNEECTEMRRVARESSFDTRKSFRIRDCPLPILPGIRNITCKGRRADVRPAKINNLFVNLSIRSGDDFRDGRRKGPERGFIERSQNHRN